MVKVLNCVTNFNPIFTGILWKKLAMVDVVMNRFVVMELEFVIPVVCKRDVDCLGE